MITQTKNIEKPNTRGCPQGSPLSPLLWDITVNSIFDTPRPPNCNIYGYADDLIITITERTRREIEATGYEYLENIAAWAKSHKLTFNTKKTQCLTIEYGTRIAKRLPSLHMTGEKLDNVASLRILGVTFDKKFSFLPHLEEVKQKITKLTAELSRLGAEQYGTPPEPLKKYYETIIEKVILYGAPAWWGDNPHTHITRKLKAIQRIPLLQITKAYYTTSNEALPALCNTPPITLQATMERKRFMLLQQREPITISGSESSRNSGVCRPRDRNPPRIPGDHTIPETRKGRYSIHENFHLHGWLEE